MLALPKCFHLIIFLKLILLMRDGKIKFYKIRKSIVRIKFNK